MTRRLPSTPDEIDAAIHAGPHVDPVHPTDLSAVWTAPDGFNWDRWRDQVPAHAVIRALHAETARLRRLLDDARRDNARLHREVVEVRAAAARIVTAAHATDHGTPAMPTLFDLEEAS